MCVLVCNIIGGKQGQAEMSERETLRNVWFVGIQGN